MLARLALAALATLGVLLLASCGADQQPAPERVTVALDFTPNAVHAPIYAAIREGHDRARGVHLQIRKPGAAPDALKLIAAGRVDLGVLDIHDLGIARQSGTDLVGVAALVQRPLAALVARADVRRPRELEGRRVGVSGLPSDPAFVGAIVAGDGGDPRRVRHVTIGFNSVASLISRRVDAVPVFWNAEGVALRRRGVRTREFRVEQFGAPPYPEVVLIASRRTLRERRPTIRRALEAIRAGVISVTAEPEPAVREIARAAGDADHALVRAQLAAVAPLFQPPLALDRALLERWADFDARIGILERRPDVARAFDFDLLR